jgi:hypothetical protein
VGVPADASLGYRPIESDYAVITDSSHVASQTMVDAYFGKRAGPGVYWQLDGSGTAALSRWMRAHPQGKLLVLAGGRLLYIGRLYPGERPGSLMIPAYDLRATMSILQPDWDLLP